MSNPGFYFYTGDWLKDTRVLPLALKGAWIDLLCVMNEHGGEICWTPDDLAQFWQVEGRIGADFVRDLSRLNTADVTFESQGLIRIVCRKMKNAALEKENARLRKQKERQRKHKKRHGHGDVTEMSSVSSSSSSLNLNLSYPKKDKKESLTLPDWLPETAWKQFKDHRQKLRKPLTRRGEVLAINRLGELRATGYDPCAVIDNSILNGWQGLFAPRESTVEESPAIKREPSDRIKRVLLRGL